MIQIQSAIILIVTSFLTSCAGLADHIQGKTGDYYVNVNNENIREIKQPIIDSFYLTNDADVRLMAVETYEWGKFDDDDFIKFKVAFDKSLSSSISNKIINSKNPIFTHIAIRSYFVAASNNKGTVLAAIDWCAADSNKQVMYQELFYATRTCSFTCTLGSIKEDVNRAAIRRILDSTINIAAGLPPQNKEADGIYLTIDKAAASMPRQLRRFGFTGTTVSKEFTIKILKTSGLITKPNITSLSKNLVFKDIPIITGLAQAQKIDVEASSHLKPLDWKLQLNQQ
jgi:hypothetical protein